MIPAPFSTVIPKTGCPIPDMTDALHVVDLYGAAFGRY
jgi:hypothetical protein